MSTKVYVDIDPKRAPKHNLLMAVNYLGLYHNWKSILVHMIEITWRIRQKYDLIRYFGRSILNAN